MNSDTERIETEQQLEELLTRPGPQLCDFIRNVSSPLLVLGAGGKMGPTLAVLARRAAVTAGHELDVIAVSRFSDGRMRSWLEDQGVRTRSCDLFNRDAVRQLPEAQNILYLVGLKFGTARNPASTWAVNTVVPSRVLERYSGARFVALSTGNVYPFTSVKGGGALEEDSLTPVGEYANAAVARERIFEFHSREDGTAAVLLRLSYAVELRYGVLVDIAERVFAGGDIHLGNGWFNCIWQGDANDMAIRSLALAETPPSSWNLCLPQPYSVREIAGQLGELMGRKPRFIGVEADTALLANSKRICERLGTPPVSMDRMLPWIGAWVARGGRSLGKPTHFEVRDGKY
jgi:nucleoside-diphosphate-sugar epimerase